MSNEIHIWEFDPCLTSIFLNKEFRMKFFEQIHNSIGFNKAAEALNNAASKYGIVRKYNISHLYDWQRGFKNDRGRIKRVRIPLWVILELSKLVTNDYNNFLNKLEINIKYYTGMSSRSLEVKNPILPIRFTPELVSIIFHLCGDGHVALTGRGTSSHYTQTNKQALENFYAKLSNCFGVCGKFSKSDPRVIIPKVVTDFFRYYFNLEKTSWYDARIPEPVKNLPKEFLVAGLTSFIVDEGSVEDTIEIYSGNYDLINDIKEIALRLKYKCSEIKRKFRYGKPDVYRFRISSHSAVDLYKDIKSLSDGYSTCSLVHKTEDLEAIVDRKDRLFKKYPNGWTKDYVLTMTAERPMTTNELARGLKINNSSLREHLIYLERQGKIKRVGKRGSHATLFSKI